MGNYAIYKTNPILYAKSANGVVREHSLSI